MSTSVVVTAANGVQQRAITKACLDAGWAVRGTRRASEPEPAIPNFVVDLETGEGLEAAFAGADILAFTLPQDHRPGAIVRVAQTVAAAAKSAGVKRIILNTAGAVVEDSAEPIFVDMRGAREAVLASGVPAIVLQPTVYMDNFLVWSLDGIRNQNTLAFPIPEHARVNFISHKTLADFVVAAGRAETAGGEIALIGGAAPMTGPQLAEILSQRLGRTINFWRLPNEMFIAAIDAGLGAPAGERINCIYARLDQYPDYLAIGPEAATRFGVAPESFAEFAARQDW